MPRIALRCVGRTLDFGAGGTLLATGRIWNGNLTSCPGAAQQRFMAATPKAALLAFLLLAACDGRQEPDAPGEANAVAPAGSAAAENAAAPADPAAADPAAPERAGWTLDAGKDGASLLYRAAADAPPLRFFCPAGRRELRLRVPELKPIGSEERMTFGTGGTVHTLVANPGTRGGGVSAAGAVPDNLAALLDGPVAVNYGAQNSGPHPAPPPNLTRPFVSACYRKLEVPADPAPPPADEVGACRRQGSETLANPPLRGVGTEPFWGVRVEGRCVTYSHPEDQDGTRVWTRYAPGPNGGGTWSGALGGQPFELRIRPQPGCSDGMSDKRYPFEAVVKVAGETRRGCAEPLPRG